MCDTLPNSVEVNLGDVALRVRPLDAVQTVDARTDRLLERYRQRMSS